MLISTYTKDDLGRCVAANSRQLDVFQMELQDYLGRTDWEFPAQLKNAAVWVANDMRIMKTGVTESFFEPVVYQGIKQWFRSVKSPLIGSAGKVIGITGMSIHVSQKTMIPLSAQQQACLKLLALGHTYKQIGDELGLSHKTVEHYIENVKNKLNCESRVELIQQAIERGLVGFI